MGGEATGKRRRRSRKAPLIAASLAMTMAAVVPALAQDSTSATGVLVKTGVASYAVTDEASGASYSLTSKSVDLDAYVDQRVTVHGAPVSGDQDGETGGSPRRLNVTGVDTPDPGQRPNSGPGQPSDSSSETQEAAQQVARVAQQAVIRATGTDVKDAYTLSITPFVVQESSSLSISETQILRRVLRHSPLLN